MTIQHLIDQAFTTLLYGLLRLPMRPEFEDDVFRDCDYVLGCARNGKLPRLHHVWPVLDSLCCKLVSEVETAAADPYFSSPQRAENETGDVMAPDESSRSLTMAEEIGEGLVACLHAVSRRDAGSLAKALSKLPPEVGIRASLPYTAIWRAFVAHARAMSLSKAVMRHIGQHLSVIETVSVQLSLNFEPHEELRHAS